MGWEAWFTLAVAVASFVAMVLNLAGTDVILIAAAALLTGMGAVSPALPSAKDFASAFGNEALIAVACLFVVAEGLVQTGALAFASRMLLGTPRSTATAQVRLMAPVVAISAFLNNTPVVAMAIPLVNDWCKRTRIDPSKLFIPLSYAAVLGGTCTLIGTSTNLVVQGLLLEAKLKPFGMFTLTPVGVAVTIAGIAFVVLTSRWLLPSRNAASPMQTDAREYTLEMIVEPGSPIDGATIEGAGLRNLRSCFLSEIDRNGETLPAPPPDQVLRGGDRLIFVGVIDTVVDLQRLRGLRPATDQVFKLDEPRQNRLLVEAVVGPTAPLVGKRIRESGFRRQYQAVILAVHRDGERISGQIGEIILRAGDVLLLETRPRFLDLHRHSKYLFISSVPNSQPMRHDRAAIALVSLAALVGINAFESVTHVSLVTASLVVAGIMVSTGCLSFEQARRSLDLQTIIAIGAALVIGRSIEKTGAAAYMGETFVRSAAEYGPLFALASVYAGTLLCTELVSNNAAAVIVFPVAKAIATSLGVSMMPFAVIVAVAASAGFALPMGYQTHLMVYGPGGYRASDFVRIGAPLDVIVGIVAVFATAAFFPF